MHNVIIDPFPQSSHETDGTIWFGHYPTSTIISPSSDLQAVMSSGLIYLCGHLHNLHGLVSTMFVRHKVSSLQLVWLEIPRNKQFLSNQFLNITIFISGIPLAAEISA